MKEKISSTLDIKKIIKILIVVLVLVTVLAALQRLFMPKYTGRQAEGALIGEYYDSPKNNDVIFLGDSEMYYNFSPKVLSDEYNINAYIRGSANQTMWQSYYLLMDTLRYEKPKSVVLSVSSLMKNESDSEVYNRMTIDGMEWSQYKYKCIKASMFENESMISYIFPILRFHSRWNEISKDDFKYYFNTPKVSDRGYIERSEIVPMTKLPSVRPLDDGSLSEKSMEYLEMIYKTCEENDIRLILVKSPSKYPYWYEEWEEQVLAYAKDKNLQYINLLLVSEDIGLDFEKDTFDGGLHLNMYGAEKCTKYFGKILTEEIK